MFQEFFACNNTEEELIKILELCGFKQDECWKDRVFRVKDALVRILIGNQPPIIAKENPYIKTFVLELYNKLREYPVDHPLYRLFSVLDKPVALGVAGYPPKYGIKEYITSN